MRPWHGRPGRADAVWYGVYDIQTCTLAYACAGHHPAFLVAPGREEAIALQTKNCAVGVMVQATYKAEVAKQKAA